MFRSTTKTSGPPDAIGLSSVREGSGASGVSYTATVGTTAVATVATSTATWVERRELRRVHGRTRVGRRRGERGSFTAASRQHGERSDRQRQFDDAPHGPPMGGRDDLWKRTPHAPHDGARYRPVHGDGDGASSPFVEPARAVALDRTVSGTGAASSGLSDFELDVRRLGEPAQHEHREDDRPDRQHRERLPEPPLVTEVAGDGQAGDGAEHARDRDEAVRPARGAGREELGAVDAERARPSTR